jgi:prophage DNA circulation protein
MTSLFENLRPASFRGVPFYVYGSDMETGRRVQVHEYPQRDTPYAQDMGRSTRHPKFDAFVVGEHYVDQANALLGALEAYGPGTLINPWFGSMQASVTGCSVAFSRELGYAKFSLSFVESGELTFPSAADSTASLSRTAADNLDVASTDFFSQAFEVAGMISDVADQATRAYGTVLDFIANPAFALASLTGWNNLPGNLASLVALFGGPLKLGQTFSGLLDLRGKAAANGITGSNAVAVPILRGLTRMAGNPALANPAPVTASTLSAKQVAVNGQAIRSHARQVILVQAVRLSSYLDAVVYDDTQALKTELTMALDAETLTTTDDNLYQALMTARMAVWQDLTERSRGAARLLTLTPAAVMPALVLAYDLHQDAGRADEIIARNNIRNPGFVPALPIKVLSR